MACEPQQDAYEQALDQIDITMAALEAFDEQTELDRQQYIYAVQAAQAQATMAWMLLDICWANHGGPPGQVVPPGGLRAIEPRMILEKIEADRKLRANQTQEHP